MIETALASVAVELVALVVVVAVVVDPIKTEISKYLQFCHFPCLQL